MEKMHFQKLQDRHRLCIFNITLFAYDFLFEQQGNSHEKYLVNKSTSNQGADMSMVHYLGQSNQGSENLSKAKKPGENLCLSHLGHSNNESCLIKYLLVAWQSASNRGNSLHPESMDIVEKSTTHNQRPARLTHLGKNKGFPTNQKGSGKMKGWNEKNLYTRHRQTCVMHWWNNKVWHETNVRTIKRNYKLKILDEQKSLFVLACHFRWRAFEEWQKNSSRPSYANSSAPSSIRSWILYFNIQLLSVSCPGMLE